LLRKDIVVHRNYPIIELSFVAAPIDWDIVTTARNSHGRGHSKPSWFAR
jgi:hypothetical protein